MANPIPSFGSPNWKAPVQPTAFPKQPPGPLDQVHVTPNLTSHDTQIYPHNSVALTGQPLANGLTVRPLAQNGHLTSIYATIPGGPNALVGAPILLSISVTPSATFLGGQFQQAKAYEVGPDGRTARDQNNNLKELPVTIMSDGRAYVKTSDEPSAPLVMLDSDGSYGLATPAELRQPGDTQGIHGYSRAQAEFLKPDGSRGFRVQEEVAGFGERASGLNAMLNSLGVGATGGREVTFSEVQETPQGLEARDVRFEQKPGDSWISFADHHSWDTMLTLNGPDARSRTASDDGQTIKLEGGWTGKRMLHLISGQAGLGASRWTYGRQTPIEFIPLSRQPFAPQPPTSD